MAFRQLPGTVVLNFFIKNTFINIVDTCDAGRYGAEAGTTSQCSGFCPAGRYSLNDTAAGPTAEDCIACAAGRFGGVGEVESQCTGECATGRYSLADTAVGPGAEDCLACDAGRFGAGGDITSQCSGP